jgi:hypothetical protein
MYGTDGYLNVGGGSTTLNSPGQSVHDRCRSHARELNNLLEASKGGSDLEPIECDDSNGPLVLKLPSFRDCVATLQLLVAISAKYTYGASNQFRCSPSGLIHTAADTCEHDLGPLNALIYAKQAGEYVEHSALSLVQDDPAAAVDILVAIECKDIALSSQGREDLTGYIRDAVFSVSGMSRAELTNIQVTCGRVLGIDSESSTLRKQRALVDDVTSETGTEEYIVLRAFMNSLESAVHVVDALNLRETYRAVVFRNAKNEEMFTTVSSITMYNPWSTTQTSTQTTTPGTTTATTTATSTPATGQFKMYKYLGTQLLFSDKCDQQARIFNELLATCIENADIPTFSCLPFGAPLVNSKANVSAVGAPQTTTTSDETTRDDLRSYADHGSGSGSNDADDNMPSFPTYSDGLPRRSVIVVNFCPHQYTMFNAAIKLLSPSNGFLALLIATS